MGTAANAMAARTLVTALVDTAETSASTTATDLATPGPAVTATTGTQALVLLTALLWNTVAANNTYMSYAVSGASTVSPLTSFALTNAGGNGSCATFTFLQTGLTAGSNIFTAKYWVSGNTGNWQHRRVTVIPL